ncbi:MAG: Lar family restriction alleviation protein [Lachnospiraceae bacterium]|nr:Lar family restriction alleviation protein [Lachnospiraceae bacterium]
MAELKSCPFCGGEVKIIPEQVDARTVAYNFVCQNGDCCANVYFDYSNKEESIEAWNTRKPMEAKVAELEVLHDLVNMNQKLAVSQAISIVRGKE